MGARVIDPDRDRPPVIEGLPVLDRLEPAAALPGAAGLGVAGLGVAGLGAGAKPPGAQGRPVDAELRLPFDARSRSRLRARLDTGVEVALVLPRGTVLRDGAVVTGSGLRVRVLAADEDVLEVRASSAIELARAAYHLGNRHVPVQVCADRLVLGYDAVLADMLVGLGTRLTRTWLPFEPEGGAYGAVH